MSSVQPTNCCCSSKSFDEHQWVMQIRRIIDEDIEDDNDIHVSIFDVPKALRDTNPNAYTPQLVALGPYHYWRPELQEMERYKLSSVKRFQNRNQSIRLHTIVDRYIMLEHKIRACYHRYLNINGETLAWMMGIDAAFLLEIGDIEGKVDYEIRKSTYNGMLRDILMLENQIPLFVLREMLGYQFHSCDLVDKTVGLVVMGLCKHLCPFKINWAQIHPSRCEHILDFLYKNMVPKVEETFEVSEHVNREINKEGKLCKLSLKLKKLLGQIPFKVIFRLPWIFICSLPGFTILKALLIPKENYQTNSDDRIVSQIIQDNKPPSVEEIMIPSVTELSKSGVIFMPTNGDITTINFDMISKQFYLPTISVDVNTEVVLRNLVAYEESSAMGPLVFTRYVELMNGIIDTNDDVRLLRERGIMLNYLKSDEEVSNLWNGMSKSLRLTRVPFLDEVIENVNRYYEGNWKVILYKFMKSYVIHSWQILASLVATLILFWLISQILCTILYSPRVAGPQARGRI